MRGETASGKLFLPFFSPLFYLLSDPPLPKHPSRPPLPWPTLFCLIPFLSLSPPFLSPPPLTPHTFSVFLLLFLLPPSPRLLLHPLPYPLITSCVINATLHLSFLHFFSRVVWQEVSHLLSEYLTLLALVNTYFTIR